MLDVVRQLQVILHRGERRRITVKPDVADAGGRHQVHHARKQTVAGAQDRHEAQLLAGQERRLHFYQRRLDRPGLHRQVAQHLVGQQQRYLVQQLAENGRWRLLVTHQGKFMQNKGMVDYGNVLSHVCCLAFR